MNAIKEFSRVESRVPTRNELAHRLGFKSVNSVQQYLSKLEEKGYIELEKGKARGMRVVDEGPHIVSLPLVGSVACGGPILAEENIEAYIPIEQSFLKDSSNYFFLSAHGDSMNSVGIDDGDLLLIESKSSAEPGEKIVALIGDEATVKVYKPNAGFVALLPQSSNPVHRPIILTSNFKIQGVVKQVIKQRQLKA
ncbi:MAG: transcriptional repressor LexA [Actinobacteria bacterium]|nr:transcriptional repressor LexA [Actinomycetota bacterium]